MLRVVAIDNKTGGFRVVTLTDEYVKRLDEEKIPVAGLLKALNAVEWKGS